MLVSEQGQHSSSSGLTLPQQNQQAGTQTQLASSMDPLQNGLVQYQLSGTNPEPPTANALGQYQPAGNNETPLAREDLNSDAIVNAQLTHFISRDDAPQGQDAPNASDVPMPDSPTVHDIATPRRTIGGRCRKWCISIQPPAGKRKCAACSMCGTRFAHGEARLQQWGNRQTNNHYVHAHCVNGGLGHDHELHPKLPMIRKQLMQSPANGTPSPEQQRIQKFYSLLLRIRIKPQQLLHLTMSGTCLGEKRLSAWMRKSWTSRHDLAHHGTRWLERRLHGSTPKQPRQRQPNQQHSTF